MKKGIIVAHNNGLGDLIVMNGCVRHLASEHDVTYLICFESRLKHYEFMYRDDPSIVLCSKPHPKNNKQSQKPVAPLQLHPLASVFEHISDCSP